MRCGTWIYLQQQENKWKLTSENMCMYASGARQTSVWLKFEFGLHLLRAPDWWDAQSPRRRWHPSCTLVVRWQTKLPNMLLSLLFLVYVMKSCRAVVWIHTKCGNRAPFCTVEPTSGYLYFCNWGGQACGPSWSMLQRPQKKKRKKLFTMAALINLEACEYKLSVLQFNFFSNGGWCLHLGWSKGLKSCSLPSCDKLC